MTTERIKTIRDALLPLDDAWDALNSLLAELDAARQHNEALETVLAQHNDFGALFQPGGRFYEEANLTLGSSAVRGGGAWLVEQLDAARAERDAAIDENIRLMNAETEALRAQLAAARAREHALTETFNERVKWIQVVEARWQAAEAREKKLREKAQNYMSQFGQALEAHGIPYAAAQSDADSALRAALAEGEDRLCASCQCRHPKDVMCPPHEMRYSAEDQ